MKHFGVIVREGKYGLKLSRDKYALINNKNSLCKFESLNSVGAYLDEDGKFYTEEWCKQHQKDCLENFDLNMRFFHSLNHDDFENALQNFLSNNNQFVEIQDLNDCDGIPGYYIMVLDEYCQLYIGTSCDIKKRIRQHWSSQKSFDRLLFPMGNVKHSVMSIDCFRALDTTRIYVKRTLSTFSTEDVYINSIPQFYLCNRIGGGIRDDGFLGYVKAKSTMKSRDLEKLE